MPDFRIYLNDELLCSTTWPPMAQAAWDRASRDRDTAQHGGRAVLLIDNIEMANVEPRTGFGYPWPKNCGPEVGSRDLAAMIVQMLRHAGVDAKALAEEMTNAGLTTWPARLKSISTLEEGRRSFVSQAELVAICSAGIAGLKRK